VVHVHVRDHDRVEVVERVALPQALDGARSEIQQHAGAVGAHGVARARSIQRCADPETDDFELHLAEDTFPLTTAAKLTGPHPDRVRGLVV
jgi:hypothetical protein